MGVKLRLVPLQPKLQSQTEEKEPRQAARDSTISLSGSRFSAASCAEEEDFASQHLSQTD